jgi:hypothetical protein
METMALSLLEKTAMKQLADMFYSYQPASGFYRIAGRLDITCYWREGSKGSALRNLLLDTYQCKMTKFKPLVEEIVSDGIVYREKDNHRITIDEIDEIIECLETLNINVSEWKSFKFKSQFVDSNVSNVKKQDDDASFVELGEELSLLKSEYLLLHSENDRAKAGYTLEKILFKLFNLFNLVSRGGFKIIGEQIDGSFELNHEIYLFEVKWRFSPTQERDLSYFRDLITGKSNFTRGVFISINGYTPESKIAIKSGKQPVFFAMDGYDLFQILQGNIRLDEYLRVRSRILAEEGEMFVEYSKLYAGSRSAALR